MNVLVIPEDFVKDQYVLKPIISAMLRELVNKTAKVRVCQDPRLHGVSEALDWNNIALIINRYKGMIDLFLLCVDRDGNAGRRVALDEIERKAAEIVGNRMFLAEHAWQEIEVWALAGCDGLPRDWSWEAIRSEVHPKERYFEPFAGQRKLLEEPGGGREKLAEESAKHYKGLRQRCSEVGALEARIRDWLDQRAQSR